MQTSAMERAAPEAALTVEERVQVPAPVAEVYRRWTDFSRFPEFMEHIQEVRPVGGRRYHWSGRFLGAKQEWDTEVTTQQENQQVIWRSVNGPPQSATVTFEPLPNNQTQVRLRMEYTPPGGLLGQKLDQLTQATRRVMRRNLENFSRLVKGEREPEFGRAMPLGIRPLVKALSLPIGTGVVGGAVAYALVRRRHPLSTRRVLLRSTLTRLERRGAIASWLLVLASVASMLTAGNYRRHGEAYKAASIAQGTPVLLGSGILARLLAQRALKPMLPGAIASWAFMSAAVGALVTALMAHLRGRRQEGLFVGHWVPTFLAGAVLSRLINRE